MKPSTTTSAAGIRMRRYRDRRRQGLHVLADEEQKRGEEADCKLIKEYLDSAARILKELAQYETPKLTAVRVGGDPVNSLPLDIKALSDDQLYGLIDRLSAEEKV